MELFIDSYDWVMVPNVYGMSQFADESYVHQTLYKREQLYLENE